MIKSTKTKATKRRKLIKDLETLLIAKVVMIKLIKTKVKIKRKLIKEEIDLRTMIMKVMKNNYQSSLINQKVSKLYLWRFLVMKNVLII